VHFDFSALPPRAVYKLLLSVVVPRPIALVTTVDAAGKVNAAPFSFFNAVSSAPPTVVLGIGPGEGDDNGIKDTRRNLVATNGGTGGFVVNLVDEPLAEAMNLCAVPFPPGVSELEEAGLTPVPSVSVRPPRIAESPVSLECTHIQTVWLGEHSTLEIGRVEHLHIRDDLVDAERHYVLTERMKLIGRMHGRGWYARTTDLFQMTRIAKPF
jgi:flavin reductase (DIM6/NTAB) family NADH-FMN oxidoreductase RutF